MFFSLPPLDASDWLASTRGHRTYSHTTTTEMIVPENRIRIDRTTSKEIDDTFGRRVSTTIYKARRKSHARFIRTKTKVINGKNVMQRCIQISSFRRFPLAVFTSIEWALALVRLFLSGRHTHTSSLQLRISMENHPTGFQGYCFYDFPFAPELALIVTSSDLCAYIKCVHAHLNMILWCTVWFFDFLWSDKLLLCRSLLFHQFVRFSSHASGVFTSFPCQTLFFSFHWMTVFYVVFFLVPLRPGCGWSMKISSHLFFSFSIAISSRPTFLGMVSLKSFQKHRHYVHWNICVSTVQCHLKSNNLKRW